MVLVLTRLEWLTGGICHVGKTEVETNWFRIIQLRLPKLDSIFYGVPIVRQGDSQTQSYRDLLLLLPTATIFFKFRAVLEIHSVMNRNWLVIFEYLVLKYISSIYGMIGFHVIDKMI